MGQCLWRERFRLAAVSYEKGQDVIQAHFLPAAGKFGHQALTPGPVPATALRVVSHYCTCSYAPLIRSLINSRSSYTCPFCNSSMR